MQMKTVPTPLVHISGYRKYPTHAALPPLDTGRWTARRKADVVTAVTSGRVTIEDVLRRYQLSIEEFTGWCRALDREGVAGLRVSHAQHNRNTARHDLVAH